MARGGMAGCGVKRRQRGALDGFVEGQTAFRKWAKIRRRHNGKPLFPDMG